MKYQRLVSSTTPSSLQDWLGQELEDRGIDSVYARSILSLLQQDYVDIEPHECQHSKSRQLKVLQKYGGPGKPFYATKSKHQKWRTREMQIMLTSTYPCCNAVLPDLEKLKKKAAVDCLRSASDYINDIEELIDEVWIRLRNIKNLKGEKDDRALRKIMDPFFIPPSSPTDEIEKYFAAFPPLNGKTEAETAVDQHKISKNAWCKRCVLKRKSDVQDEVTHESSNAGLRSSSKCTQPIIPYSSLKPIKNVYKNEIAVPSKYEEIGSFSKVKRNISGKNPCRVKKITGYERFWKTKKSVMLCLQLPLKNLFQVTLFQFSMKKAHFIELLQHITFQNLAINLNDVKCSDALLKLIADLNFDLDNTKNKTLLCDTKENEYVSSTQLQHEDVPEIHIFRSNINSTVSTCHALESGFDEAKQLILTGLYSHFKMPPLSDVWDYAGNPHLDITQSLSDNDYGVASACSYTDNENISFKNMFDFINETGSIFSKSETSPSFQESLLSYNEQSSLNVNASMWEQGNSAFHALPEKNTMRKFQKDFELACSKIKLNEDMSAIIENPFNRKIILSDEEISTDIILSDEEISNEIILSDEEIFYSDDDSNEIFHSDEENLFTSCKTHFQPIQISCSMFDAYPEVSKHTREANNMLVDENLFQSQFKIDQESDIVLENKKFSNCENENEKLAEKFLSVGKVLPNATETKTGSLSSSYEELAAITQFKFEKPCDKNIACEQKYKFETSQTLRDKGTNTENISEQFSTVLKIEQNENTTSSKHIDSEYSDKNNQETCNKMWLFYWGDNHSFIASTWQKDSYNPTVRQQNDGKFSYNSEIINALSKEIKEEGEELLKGLGSMSDIPNDTIKDEITNSAETDLPSSPMDMYCQSLISVTRTEDILDLGSKTSTDQNLVNEMISKHSTPLTHTSFTLSNNKSSMLENEISYDIPSFNLCSSFYESDKYLYTRSIQSQFGNAHLHKNNYLEGGGWSLASDNFSDFDCENIYERASSLGDLDLEKSEAGCFELYRQNKRLRCTSETNEEINPTGSKLGLNMLQKRAKQKYAPRKRPCCFFLQGNCTRNDCRFSHDLSTTTCRFWKEGSCFKGSTCPFFHGYISENDPELLKSDQCLENDSLDNSYSLESESDFPSLSSVKASKEKSDAVDIIQTKASKKNKERKLLN